MRIAAFGDVVGRSGRTALIERLPRLRRELGFDFVVVNAENAAGGFGITRRICEELFEAGADALTTGNHAYDQREEIDVYIDESRLLRPLNFPPSNPGRGAGLFTTKSDARVLVLHAQGQVHMPANDDPFAAVDRALAETKLGREADAILVDMHGEATSEKQAMGAYLDGRVSVVFGTHTHAPTADERVLPGGTAFITDLGMCGDYDSIIGMEKTEPVKRFLTKMTGARFAPAAGPATICGVVVDTNEEGLASSIVPIRVGGVLRESGLAGP
jgi:hypothetical protein